ncbi:hypothetical protein HDU93_001511, partial [Gonapodya sp. JEL0774]
PPLKRSLQLNLTALPTEIILHIGRYLPFRLGLPSGALSKRLAPIFRTPSSIADRALAHYTSPATSLVVETLRPGTSQHPVIEAIVERISGVNDRRWLNQVVPHPRGETTALEAAAQVGHLHAVQILVKLGADVQGTHNGFKTGRPLLCACLHGKLEVVRFLLEHGADIHVKDDEALYMGVRSGQIEIVRILMSLGADVNAGNGKALEEASYSGHLDIILLLLDNGANIHAGDDGALWSAVAKGRLKTVQLLLDRGADARRDSGSCKSYALTCAQKQGYEEVIELVRKHGACVSTLSPRRPFARITAAKLP